ncbi:MAG: hypothetical protein AAF587_03165 [Bacteroidota bacterium]
MNAVKVQYKVQENYVEQNKANIRKVMDRLKANPIEGMMYSTYTLEDGQTFVHINIGKDAETIAKLNGVEEFTAFRTALKASNPIEGPTSTKLSLVAAGFDL